MKLEVQGREAYAYTGGRPFDASLPALVFVHGALHDHSVWTLLARWFAHHGWGVLAVDLPAHGRSAGPALESVEAMATWLLALQDAAGVHEASLVGHSMGSLVALEAASIAPVRAQRLVMVGTAYPMVVSPALLESAVREPLVAIDNVNAYSHSTLAGKPSHPGPGMWLRGANRTLMRRVQAGGAEHNLFLTDFTACDRYRHGLEAAARVACPSTLVLGARDQMTGPKLSADLARTLRAEVITLPAGHALMTEAPDAILAALRAALAPAAAIA